MDDDDLTPLEHARAVRDEAVQELDALLNYDGPGDGCRVPPPPPRMPRRRRRRLTPEELAEKHMLREQGLTAYGITLKPRTIPVYRACRTFLALRTREAFQDLFQSLKLDEAHEEELIESARQILMIAERTTSITVITPMVDPLCHRLYLDVKCTERAKIKATVICKACGQVRTRLCLHHFSDLMEFLPESKAYCANPSPGLHQLVALVEGQLART